MEIKPDQTTGIEQIPKPSQQEGDITSEPPTNAKDRRTLREFSRRNSPEERRGAATEISATRKGYFERKERLTAEIRQLTKETLAKESKLSETIDEIQEIEKELAERKTSTIRQLLDLFGTKRLQKELEAKSLERVQFEQDYVTLRNSLETLQYQQEDKKELEEAKKRLEGFYQGQSEKLEAYLKDQRDRDLRNVVSSYQVIFVHGIHPDFTPGNNSLLNKDVNWKTKLKILLSFAPTISASTIQEGDKPENMWARMGVILSGGSIVSAYTSDMGTVAESLRERSFGGETQSNIGDRIKEAILSRKTSWYNELVVANPKVAGFYICLERRTLEYNDLVSVNLIVKAAQEFGLPVYAIKNGSVYEAKFARRSADEFLQGLVGKSEIVLGWEKAIPLKKILPEQVIQRESQIPETQRQEIIAELFADSPFRIKSPEVVYVDSKHKGRETYVEINVPQKPESFLGEEIIYNGAKARVITSFPEIGFWVQYLLTKQGLFKEIKNKNTGEVSSFKIRKFDEFGHGYIRLDSFVTHDLRRPITDNEAYLSGMEESISRVEKEKDVAKGEKRIYKEWLRKLAFHLYGFGEQAAQFGNTETQERAFEIAKTVMPYEEYQEILTRRLDKEGRLKITEADWE